MHKLKTSIKFVAFADKLNLIDSFSVECYKGAVRGFCVFLCGLLFCGVVLFGGVGFLFFIFL